jgi:hypothetical protein
MKHNNGFHDQYQRPDKDDEGLDRIQTRFERLARKMRDDSGTGQIEFIHPATHHDAPVVAQSKQGLFPMMAAWPTPNPQPRLTPLR